MTKIFYNTWTPRVSQKIGNRTIYTSVLSSAAGGQSVGSCPLDYLSEEKDRHFKFIMEHIDEIDVIDKDTHKIMTLEDFDGDLNAFRIKKKKEVSLAIQMHSTGYRLSANFLDFGRMVGVYCDMDIKEWFKLKGITASWDKPNEMAVDLLNDINNILRAKVPNAYFSQISASNSSFHFVFAYELSDDEKNPDMFKFLAASVQKTLEYHITKLGETEKWIGPNGENILLEIIKTPGVMDNCGKKPAQPLLISENEIHVLHDSNFPRPTIVTDDDLTESFLIARGILADPKKYDNGLTAQNTDNYYSDALLYDARMKCPYYYGLLNAIIKEGTLSDENANLENYDIPEELVSNGKKFTLHEPERYQIARTLKTITNSFEEWKKLHDYIVENNYSEYKGNSYYTISSMKRAFDKDYKAMDRNKPCFGLLKKFGIDIKQKQKFYGLEGQTINGWLAHETIELDSSGDNAFISNHYDKIIDTFKYHKNVYIKAGCGVGKSTFFRNILEKEERVMIVCHLNSIKNGVFGKREETKSDIFNVAVLSNKANFIYEYKDIKKIIDSKSPLPLKMVINWNTFHYILEKEDISLINRYVKCFDESHNLVTTANYRNGNTKGFASEEKMISAIINPKYNLEKMILCSGTPQYEWTFFSDVYCFEFIKEDSIKYNIICDDILSSWDKFTSDENVKQLTITEKASSFLVQYMKDNIDLDNYDKILFFTNQLNKTLPEYIRRNSSYLKKNGNEINVTYFNRTNVSTDNEFCNSVLKDNFLKDDMFVTTIFGSQGIEIKNEIDSMLAVFICAEVTFTDFIQTIHRFRNVKNITVLFLNIPSCINDSNDSMMLQCINSFCALSPADRTKLLELRNKQLSMTLLHNNITAAEHDIRLAYRYIYYIKNEKCNFWTIKTFFNRFSDIPYNEMNSSVIFDEMPKPVIND